MPLPNSAAIKAIRKVRGLTGTELAAKCGISHGHLFNIESPLRVKKASADLLEKLARELAVPVDAITIPETTVMPRRRALKTAA